MFPEYFDSFKKCGIVGQVLTGNRGKNIKLNTVSIREFSPKDFKGVDDAPYGGGPGMVMRPDVLKNALLKGVVEPGNYGEDFREQLHIVYPGPRGITWNFKKCKEFAKTHWSENTEKDLVFICGRYEGIDERLR